MNASLSVDKSYIAWLSEIKTKIRTTQIRAALAANAVLIQFYYELGRMITEKQTQTQWGDKLVERLANDLRSEFPEMRGFSRTNLLYCKQFYLFINTRIQTNNEIVPQCGGQLAMKPVSHFLDSVVFNLPWSHIKVILGKVKDLRTAAFYFTQTFENAWSRDVLAMQIKSELHKRQGGAVTNFSKTLPQPMSDLAQQTLKDPYILDFITLTAPYREKDIENQLVQHLAKFILELGKGFAFIGRQYHLEIAGTDYYIDLLFYHVVLKCYVVIELKNTKFLPEYAGKLNFYLSAVDSLLKRADDMPTIGIMLCREKKNIEVEFALRDINKPIGVSEISLTNALPDNLASSLPTIEEIETELGKL
jgi:predicted nuclease of restriction endonuclease-like (RecB) superfamily